ncbi:hypothetical protein cyc_01948 [Cyclospora cayetanensis]|uniref:Uncharacterized protein n=1 Tax=Cyclospora cayetanensis TaxID=88456 RepID=A0A1D3CVQ6_9EIME|nr:hypothetical protein cyc_01948 [Cyclospora cayetanensis]
MREATRGVRRQLQRPVYIPQQESLPSMSEITWGGAESSLSSRSNPRISLPAWLRNLLQQRHDSPSSRRFCSACQGTHGAVRQQLLLLQELGLGRGIARAFTILEKKQRRPFAKIVRWRPDTPLAYGLETFTEADDFLKACEQNKGTMTRRDWLAALSMLSTRRRLDLRSTSFKAFVAAALQQEELLKPRHVHLTIHREEWNYPPSRVGPHWCVGMEALRLASCLTLSDLSMIIWAFARVERMKPAEIVKLKEEVLNRLDAFVKQALFAAYALPNARATPGQHGSEPTPTPGGLTAVWTALKDAEVAKVFSLPQHKRPLSSSSGSRHLAYLPFRDIIPLECLPLLLAILKPAQSYLRDASTGTDASVTLEPTAQTPHTVKEETEFSKLEEASALPPETLRMAAAAVASGAAGLKSNALLRGACCDVLLEVLCEETRLLRLDHTTNTSMVAALAAALADMQLVDPRVVYQLVLFAQQRGAAQFQGDQLLTVLQAFEKCQIADSKAWAKLAHRAQDIAADLNLKGLRRLRKLTWRAGHSNARLEGVFDHFEALKEDIEKCGPI